MMIRRVLAMAFAAATVGACGTDKATGPKELTAAQLAGAWELSRQPNAQCSGVGTTTVQKYFFTVERGEIPADTKALNVVSKWEVAQPYRFDWTVSGNFNVRTMEVRLRFWRSTGVSGSQFIGTIAPDGQSAEGSLSDPIPGFSPHFTFSPGCLFTASIVRVSPG